MSIKSTTKGAPRGCESSNAIKERFLRYLPQLNSKQLNIFAEIMQIMVDKRKDVYFIVCTQGKTTYQGYSINQALDVISTTYSQLIDDVRSKKRLQSHILLCIYPNNLVTVLFKEGVCIGGEL